MGTIDILLTDVIVFSTTDTKDLTVMDLVEGYCQVCSNWQYLILFHRLSRNIWLKPPLSLPAGGW